MSYLNKLLNKQIVQVETGIDQVYALKSEKNEPDKENIYLSFQLFFADDFMLEIYNPFSIVDNHKSSLKEILIGKVLTTVSENEIEASFSFNLGELILKVDLRQESFIGPEAMCLHGPDNLIVVWN